MSKQTKKFKTEVQELLNLVISSLYSNKDIFLRELVSNSSDAIDKLRFEAFQDKDLLPTTPDFKVKLVADKEAKTLTIVDNGIGMSPEELALALSPYGQVLEAQTHTHIRGTGLGLPVSKRSIEALGGDFSITSEPGLGTAITLRFPPDLVVHK